MRAWGEAAFPEEACGFLLGTASTDGAQKQVALALAAENQRAEERHRRFLLPPEAMLRAEEEAARRGLDVIGIWHSHPNGVAKPSDFDREHAWPWYSYVIVGVTFGKATEVTSWRLAEDRGRFNREDMVQIAASDIERR